MNKMIPTKFWNDNIIPHHSLNILFNMSFVIIFCNPSCMPNVLCKQNWNSSIFKLLWYNLVYIHTKMLYKTKQMLHEKMWVLPHAPLYQKCMSKKKNQNGECLQAFNSNK